MLPKKKEFLLLLIPYRARLLLDRRVISPKRPVNSWNVLRPFITNRLTDDGDEASDKITAGIREGSASTVRIAA